MRRADERRPEILRQLVAVLAMIPILRISCRTASCNAKASGGITLERIRSLSEAGVDVISVGALTHSAPAADIALDLAL